MSKVPKFVHILLCVLYFDAFLCTDCSTLKRGVPSLEALARRQNFQTNVAQDGAFHTNIQSSGGGVPASAAVRPMPPNMKDPSSLDADSDSMSPFGGTSVSDLMKDLRNAFQQGGLMPQADPSPMPSQYLHQSSVFGAPSPNPNSGYDNMSPQVPYYPSAMSSQNIMSTYDKPAAPTNAYDLYNSYQKQPPAQQSSQNMQQYANSRYKYEQNPMDCSYNMNDQRTPYQNAVDPREAEIQDIVNKLKSLLSRP